MRHPITDFVIVGACVVFIGVGLGHLEKERKMQKAINEVTVAEVRSLDKKVGLLEKKLKAYTWKVDDLSIAYINHHGNFPRRKRDEQN